MLFIVLLNPWLACSQATNTTKGGSSGDGVMTGIIGHPSDNTAVSAILDAAVGGTPGTLIGRQMDKFANELKAELKDAKIERVGEGIVITFESRLLFEHDSFELRSTSNLKELAKTLNKYNQTNALIEGHTDGTGEELYNQSLSDKRAREVEDYLMQRGVKDDRMSTKGYGESQPLVTDDTEAGKQTNRRVMVAIYANDEMKYLARKGELKEYIASKK